MHNNPYVGPRPYERADRANFFGRGREARDLLALMLAECVLLFYAQSGAGKTSLLNAQVIPALEDKGFDVLPVARVGSDLPPGIDLTAVSNVFVFSALMGLAGADVAPGTLLEHTLLSFLQTRVTDKPPLLILDQFEELFTTHHDRWQEARDFFIQVRQALEGIPNLGVTLAMREDHIAELDAYAPLLPGRLRARFRMERLGPQAAVDAVAKPAANAGCPFDPGVAERLVDDLRRIKTQLPPSVPPDGGGEKGGTSSSPPLEGIEGGALGPYVEPVQLQVVCNRLWERLPDQHDNAIQWAEVEQYGNIDRALVDFYESALTLAKVQANSVCPPSHGLVVTERHLRRWFSEELITPMETRGLAMRGPDDTAGLPNAAVDALEAQHLIRADIRAGARWYELCHDRMVEPIVQSNRGWEQAQDQAHPWRAIARQWQVARSETLLYRGRELAEAQAWLEAVPSGEVEPYERAFIQESQKAARARAHAHARDIVTVTALVILVVVLSVQPVRRQLLKWQAQRLGELVFIEASQPLLGDDALFSEDADIALPANVYPVRAFAIEKNEVTNERYLLCVNAGVCSPPNAPRPEYMNPAQEKYPVTRITAIQASQFCAWIGRRLPTELEWERAARAEDGWLWPWGDVPPENAKAAYAYFDYEGLGGLTVQSVGQTHQGRSQEGVYDLAGNAWEWTCTPYAAAAAYDPGVCADLIEQFPSLLVIKGGGVDVWPDAIASMAYHQGISPDSANRFRGFRCAEER